MRRDGSGELPEKSWVAYLVMALVMIALYGAAFACSLVLEE